MDPETDIVTPGSRGSAGPTVRSRSSSGMGTARSAAAGSVGAEWPFPAVRLMLRAASIPRGPGREAATSARRCGDVLSVVHRPGWRPGQAVRSPGLAHGKSPLPIRTKHGRPSRPTHPAEHARSARDATFAPGSTKKRQVWPSGQCGPGPGARSCRHAPPRYRPQAPARRRRPPADRPGDRPHARPPVPAGSPAGCRLRRPGGGAPRDQALLGHPASRMCAGSGPRVEPGHPSRYA